MVIRKLSAIKHYLSVEQLKVLICSYIFLRMDYCNALYYGLNQSSLNKLQHVQNCAARLLQSKRYGTHLDEVFSNNHWLKVRERILFKILLIVHKCIHEKAPPSLCKFITFGDSDRSKALRETKVKTKYGDRAFSNAGPKLWNLLPLPIRNQESTEKFKKMLKSYLMFNGQNFSLEII